MTNPVRANQANNYANVTNAGLARRKATRALNGAQSASGAGNATKTPGDDASGAQSSGARASAQPGDSDTDSVNSGSAAGAGGLSAAASNGCVADLATGRLFGVSLAGVPRASTNVASGNYDFDALANLFVNLGMSQCAPAIDSARIGFPASCPEMSQRIGCEGNIGYFIPDEQAWTDSDAFTRCLLQTGGEVVARPDDAQAHEVCPTNFAALNPVLPGEGASASDPDGGSGSANHGAGIFGMNPVGVAFVAIAIGFTVVGVGAVALHLVEQARVHSRLRGLRNAGNQANGADTHAPSFLSRARQVTANVAANLPTLPAMPHFGGARRSGDEGLRPLVLVDRLRAGGIEAQNVQPNAARDEDAQSVRSAPPSYHAAMAGQGIELQAIQPRDLV